MLARLRPGTTVAQAQSQLEALNAAHLEQAPMELRQQAEDAGFTTIAGSFHADLVRAVRPWLLLLWGGALFVLLIGAVSITNLLLVRSTGRLQELATRYVLGAGRPRLARQLLTESLVLALVGGGLGLLLAQWSLRLVNVFEVYEIPRVGEVRIDPAAMAILFVVSFAVMAFSSLVATLAVGRRDLFAVLRAGAAIASQLPFSGWNNGTQLTPEGWARKPGDSVAIHFRTAVSGEYFDVMGIPLVEGRTFTDSDDAEAARVVIVSEEVARRYWSGNDPVGRKVFLGDEPGPGARWHTVVGVVGDVVQNELTETAAKGACYIPYRQSYIGFSRWVAKAEQDPYALLPSIRQRVFEVHPTPNTTLFSRGLRQSTGMWRGVTPSS